MVVVIWVQGPSTKRILKGSKQGNRSVSSGWGDYREWMRNFCWDAAFDLSRPFSRIKDIIWCNLCNLRGVAVAANTRPIAVSLQLLRCARSQSNRAVRCWIIYCNQDDIAEAAQLRSSRSDTRRPDTDNPCNIITFYKREIFYARDCIAIDAQRRTLVRLAEL